MKKKYLLSINHLVRNITIFLIFICLFFSCTKKTQVIQSKTDEEAYQGNIDTIATKEVETFDEAINPIEKTPPTVLIPSNYLLTSLRKTECYGNCPVFEFIVLANGKATYKGVKYVDQLGEFIAEIDDATIQIIKDKAEQLGISQLQDTYPRNKVFLQDLPMTFSSFHNGRNLKRIRNNYDAPKALLEYELFLEKIIQQINWKRADRP